MAADAIFLDVLPRFDWVAAETGTKKLVAQFDKSTKEIGRAFGVNTQNAAKAATDQIVADVAKMQREVNRSTTQATEDFRRLTKSHADVEVSTRRLTEMTAKYGETSSQATRALYAQSEAQTRLTQTTNAYSASLAKETEAAAAATAAQVEHQAALTGSGTKMAVLGAAANTAGLLAAGATTLIAGATTKMAADFQSSQERLVTTAGESKDALESVSKGLLDMAGQVGYTAEQLSKGMYTVESAGYHGAEGLKVMKAAAQGAKAENADLTEVTNAVTTALHDFHLSADESAIVTSKMITAVSQGKTTFADLTSALHSVQPIAASLVDTTKDLATQQAQGKHIMDDMLGSLAQMTASGMSAEQATQNMADAYRHLQNPTAQMRAELAQLGIDSRDLQEHLGDRGLAGSMEVISQTILERMGPSGKVMLDSFNQSKLAADDAGKMMNALPPAARQLADAANAGQIGLKEFMKAMGGLPEPQANLLRQWKALHDRASGFSDILKAGGNDVQTYTAAMAKATGDSSTLNVALQLTGQNTLKTNETIAMIANTTANADGSVRGWAETQATFNTRLAQAKASFGALAIEIGNMFLPTMTNVVKALGTAAHWLGEHQGLVKALVIGVGALGAAWAVYRTAMGIATVAMAAFNAVVDANPIGLIVLAIAGLVAAIVYAYNHFTWFKNGVNTVWEWLKSFGRWFASTFGPIWHTVTHAIAAVWSWLVDHVIKPYIAVLKVEFHVISTVVKWLWENAFRPVFHAIGDVVKWLVDHVVKPYGAFLKLEFHLIGIGAKSAWEHFIRPAFHAIGEVVKWLVDHVVKPYGAFLKAEFTVIGTVVKWLWEHWFKPHIQQIGDIIKWLWDHVVKPLSALLKAEFQALGEVVGWLWHNAVEPAAHGIGEVFSWLYNNIIKPAAEMTKADWHGMGVAWHTFYEQTFKPTAAKIGEVVNHVKEFFKDMVTEAKTQWNLLKTVVAEPVKFIVNTVYDKGIANVYNHIADVFGGPHLPQLTFDGFAGGGILPGYSPGRDNMLGRLPSGRVVGLSGGEGILVPELARMLGPGLINSANAAASGGRRSQYTGKRGGYDVGGIAGDISDLADAASDPLGALTNAVNGLMPGMPGDKNTQWIQTIARIPAHLVELLASSFGDMMGAAGGNHAPPAAPAQVLDWIRAAERLVGVGEEWTGPMSVLVMRESGGRVDAVNTTDSNAARGDPSKGLAQTIGGTFRAYHRPEDGPADPFNPVSNLAAAMRYIQAQYGTIFKVQQANPNMPAHGYDTGTGSAGDEDNFGGFGQGTDPFQLGASASAGTGRAGALAGLPPLGAKGSEQGAQLDTIMAARAVAAAFPQITNIGMYRGPDGYNEHSSGEAADVMIPNAASPAGVALGNKIARFALANASRYGVKYVLWHQRTWNPDGTSTPMEDRGSPTQNHMDHVHIRTAGGGFPQGGGPGAQGVGSMPAGTLNTPAPGGLPAGLAGGGAGGGTIGGGGGTSGGMGASSGGMTGSSILTGMGDTKNWNVKGIAQFVGAALANLALGNPIGKMMGRGAGGGAEVAAGGYPPASPLAAPTIDASASALANYNGQNAKLLQYKSELANADERIAKAQAHLNEEHAKHPGGGAVVDQAQHSLDLANQHRGDLLRRIGEQGQNAGVQSGIDAERLAQQRASGHAGLGTERALEHQQEIAGAATQVLGGGPGGVPGPGQPGFGAPALGLPGSEFSFGGGGGLPGRPGGAPQGGPSGGGSFPLTPGTGQSGGLGGGIGSAMKKMQERPSSVTPTKGYGQGQDVGPGFSTSIAETALAAAGPFGAMAGPGGQVAAKAADRTIGYIGQLGGIAASGLLETFLPSGVGDKLADPSKSWLGKLALGVAGAHSEGDNRAGASAPPVDDKASKAAADTASPTGMPDQPQGGQGGPGQGQGQSPLIGEMNITQTQPVDGGKVGRDLNAYAGGMTR